MKTNAYSAKLVWFTKGPAWTCQLNDRHVITIHHGDSEASWVAAMLTAAKLNATL